MKCMMIYLMVFMGNFLDILILLGIRLNNWEVKVILLPKTIKPNFHWKWRNGSLILVKVDSITGIEYIVINDGPEEAIEVIFRLKLTLL